MTQIELQKFISGDRKSFDLLYKEYHEKIYCYALKITRSPELAEEIVHDVFIKLWSNRDKIKLEYSFSSFVFRVTHNHAVNLLKKSNYERAARKEVHAKREESSCTTENTVIHNEYMQTLSEAIGELPPKRKNIFILSRSEGVSHDEIALKMDISKNTVKSQIVKATKTIRDYFQLHSDFSF